MHLIELGALSKYCGYGNGGPYKVDISNVGVIGTITGSKTCICGIIGRSESCATNFKNCYVQVNIGGAYDLGGFINTSYSATTLENCYFSGTLTDTFRTGPLVNANDNNNETYSSLVTITNSYYNKTKYTYSAPKSSETGLTTDQFANSSNFNGWDFTNTWIIKDGYPELRVFLTAEEIYALEHPDTQN